MDCLKLFCGLICSISELLDFGICFEDPLAIYIWSWDWCSWWCMLKCKSGAVIIIITAGAAGEGVVAGAPLN